MLLSILLNRYVIGAGVGIVLLGAAYTKGHMDASQNCHDGELRAKIETLQQDIAVAKSAAIDEATRANGLELKNSESSMKVESYERILAGRKGDTCDLNDDDLRGVRGIDGSNAR